VTRTAAQSRPAPATAVPSRNGHAPDFAPGAGWRLAVSFGLGFARFFPLLLAVLAVLAATGGSARAADPVSRLMKGPLIRFDERLVDFGRIPQHVTRPHTFVIHSEGTEPLRILKVSPDCGCTLAQVADTVIAPGDSTTLRVVFDSGSYSGEQRKVVILETNDPAEPRVDLQLLSYVARDIENSKRVLAFGPVRRGTTPALSTTLTAEPGVPFTVHQPVGGEDLVEWTVARDPESGPGSWKVEARLRPDAPFGRFNVRAEIPVDHPTRKSETVSIRGLVHSYFSPVDLGINFGSLKAGHPVARTLELKADGEGDYRITAARPSVPWLTASLRKTGRDYLLTLTIDAKQPMRVREKVTLLTTDPEQPEMVFDVIGTVR
jgi:hypothetical protein